MESLLLCNLTPEIFYNKAHNGLDKGQDHPSNYHD